MSRKVAIGIDLGTTYSCVGVFRNGRVDIIANERGSRITSSFVAFNECERLVGDAAKEQAAINPKNTVFEAKRLIGRKFADVTVQEDIRQWPFEVLNDNGSPKIKVQYRGQAKILTPEEISACILTKLKKVAEDYIGDEVHDAVITVPAYFNDSQRQATIDAGKIAGLNVLGIINEPTAAALAYGYDKKVPAANKNILIFDLGGGTFDVVVLSTNGKSYDVKAVGGDTHLGGGDFDTRLVQHFLKLIERNTGKDLSKNQRALSRLRKSCENAKIGLSGSSSASLDIECLVDGEDFREKITRKRFEGLCSDLFAKTITHVESVIGDSGIVKKCIDEVILVGGSSRIPKIQELLSKFFDGKKLDSTINPDEAVAYGAAVKAALMSGEHTIEEIKLADVVPLSLGQRNFGGDMITFIKRNSRIPITVVQKTWSTSVDYQMSSIVRVYEGEREIADCNNLLGCYWFNTGERALAGVPKITCTFTVDENGILYVSCENRKTKCYGGLTINSIKGRLTKKEIKEMKRELEECSARPLEDAGPSMEALEAYCLEQTTKARALCTNGAMMPYKRDWVVTWCDEALEWLEDNEDLRIEDYEEKLREMKFKCGPVFSNAKDVSST